MMRLGREFSDSFSKCPSFPGAPSMREPSPVRSPHFPLDGRCMEAREALPCLPRTVVPVWWTVRGEGGAVGQGGSVRSTEVTCSEK